MNQHRIEQPGATRMVHPFRAAAGRFGFWRIFLVAVVGVDFLCAALPELALWMDVVPSMRAWAAITVTHMLLVTLGLVAASYAVGWGPGRFWRIAAVMLYVAWFGGSMAHRLRLFNMLG